jgi:hypothetical protein
LKLAWDNQNNNINVTVAGSGNPQRDGNAISQTISTALSMFKFNMIGSPLID